MGSWSEWLQGELDSRNWRQADFVRESHGHIKRDRVSKWLSGAERPAHRYAIIVANTLGLPQQSVLAAAGLPTGVAETAPTAVNLGLSAYTELDLLDELRRRARGREERYTTDEISAVQPRTVTELSAREGSTGVEAESDDHDAYGLAASDDDDWQRRQEAEHE